MYPGQVTSAEKMAARSRARAVADADTTDVAPKRRRGSKASGGTAPKARKSGKGKRAKRPDDTPEIETAVIDEAPLTERADDDGGTVQRQG